MCGIGGRVPLATNVNAHRMAHAKQTQRRRRVLEAVVSFSTGFIVPATVVASLLWIDHGEGVRWSGFSPLGHLLWIPVAYAVASFLALTVRVVRRQHRASSVRLFLAGLIGGFPLLLFSHATASFLAGIELPLLATSYASVVVLTLGARRRRHL